MNTEHVNFNLLASNKYIKKIPKAGHRLALGMKLQKEVISNQKTSKL